MITEDYVSFETAKLLKEKGFDWECISYYVDDEPNDVKYSFCGETNSDWESRCCSAPTLQMAIKWFLKKYNIFICVLFLEESNGFGYTLENIITRRYIATSKNLSYKEPEDACEAAIKYCLENLI